MQKLDKSIIKMLIDINKALKSPYLIFLENSVIATVDPTIVKSVDVNPLKGIINTSLFVYDSADISRLDVKKEYWVDEHAYIRDENSIIIMPKCFGTPNEFFNNYMHVSSMCMFDPVIICDNLKEDPNFLPYLNLTADSSQFIYKINKYIIILSNSSLQINKNDSVSLFIHEAIDVVGSIFATFLVNKGKFNVVSTMRFRQY